MASRRGGNSMRGKNACDITTKEIDKKSEAAILNFENQR